MATYELTIITPGSDDVATASAIVEDTKGALKEVKAVIKQEHQWGRRPLAYTIAKQSHGYYTTFEFEAEPTSLVKVERSIRMHGKVMRFLTTNAFDEPASLAAPAPVAAVDDETRTAEEQLRRSSAADAPKRPAKKKVAKPESAEDETERQHQVEEALSKILEDEPEKK